MYFIFIGVKLNFSSNLTRVFEEQLSESVQIQKIYFNLQVNGLQTSV
jgi:hypothetical protein